MPKQVFAPGDRDSRLKFVTDEVALDGSNPTPINLAGYLTKVIGVILNMKGSVAPGATPAALLTYDIVGTVVNVYAWRPTATADTALIASTDTDTFTYIAIGY